MQAEMRRGEERVDVGADAEEGDVAEVEQAGEADHDVEPERQGGIEADARRPRPSSSRSARRAARRGASAPSATASDALPCAGRMAVRPCSPVGTRLAEQPGGPEHQHQDQHHEGDHVLEAGLMKVTARLSITPRIKPAQHRAPDVADAAEHRRGERLQSGRVAHEEVDLRVVEADQHAGRAAERGAEEEGERDHAPDVTPMTAAISRSSATARIDAAERGALHQHVEAPHHQAARPRHDEHQHRDVARRRDLKRQLRGKQE